MKCAQCNKEFSLLYGWHAACDHCYFTQKANEQNEPKRAIDSAIIKQCEKLSKNILLTNRSMSNTDGSK